MDRKLRGLVGALKDKASLSKAALLSSSSSSLTPTTTTTISPHLAVLRATTHHPSTSPPDSRHIATLLSFGYSSRLFASSLVDSLSSRLSTTRDPSVALKSLLCLHHLLSRGSFILLDQLSSSLLPSSGRRNPLNLSSFHSPQSFTLSSWVRWYARLLELLLSIQPIKQNEEKTDWLTSLLNRDLIKELDSLVAVVEEINRAPEMLNLENNRLILEVVRLAEEDRMTTQHGILIRVREMRERLGERVFADSVELACLIRRLEDCRGKWKGWDLFWSEVREVRDRVGEMVAEEKGRVRRERVSESARVVDRVIVGSDEVVRFGSSRWVNG